MKPFKHVGPYGGDVDLSSRRIASPKDHDPFRKDAVSSRDITSRGRAVGSVRDYDPFNEDVVSPRDIGEHSRYTFPRSTYATYGSTQFEIFGPHNDPLAKPSSHMTLNEMQTLSLQSAQQKQAQIMQTMSSIMKSFHDTSKAIINNLR